MTRFEKNILTLYGVQGQQWLDQLPKITENIAKKHDLDRLVPMENLSFNYVVSGYQYNKPIILKIGLNRKALIREATCLKRFSDHITPHVIANNDHMILMDRAVPGTTLKAYFLDKDNEASMIFCSIVDKLHATGGSKICDIEQIDDVLMILDKAWIIPECIVSKARNIRDGLLASTTKKVLLHGDLHHENILKNGDGWLVIDPKGYIGDPAFEFAAFLSNPMPALLKEHNAKQLIAERIALCAEHFHLSEQRMKDWLYVKAVLCWIWCLDDGLDARYWRELLALLSK